MVVGEKITRDGKTYVVTDVWGNNFGMREVKDEVPVFEETLSFEEEVKEAIETPKKKVVRRKKA